ncbi:phage baseplate assembly protein [Bradyrhizobium jicamae]|uniref:phage baseplate assembly protein domain-containing protein n=1 Tax=Bradyrhizobium jicamae TaxID=280332 RepID=UPI001BA8A779|nr:phage baseplate assembly protein [Bradyrhizobium jicamae]MBR0753516.1 phage baseplate assembly protein [Bradyrhizobium jicamae]
MHRATPLNTSIRAYTAGGSRSVVDKVDDQKLMQEMGGNFMANETRAEIESPQNYGFTSVVFDAEKGADGKIAASAETFVGFMGGNRSFPVSGPMDDRRHRLYKLEKGDTAMFRGRGDKQQFHLTKDGGFWTAPQDKTVRMQLLDKDSESNSTQGGGSGSGGAGAHQLAADGSAGGGQQQGQQKRGQEALYKDGQKGNRFVDVTKDRTRASGKQVHLMLDDGNTYVHCHTDKQVYVGGEAGKGAFDYLATLSGPCVNSLGKIG